jgi:hypothetical protein
MLPVGIEVVGACAAEPIDTDQATALALLVAPATSTVCCPAPDTPGRLTVYDLSGSGSAAATPAEEDSTALLDGLNLQPVRARVAISVDTGGGSGSDAASSAEIVQRLQECHIHVGSAIVPPGDAANRTLAGAALTVSSIADAGRPNKPSGTGKQTRAGGPTREPSTAVQDRGVARATLHNFADVRVLWPLTPAADYGGAALQVRAHCL